MPRRSASTATTTHAWPTRSSSCRRCCEPVRSVVERRDDGQAFAVASLRRESLRSALVRRSVRGKRNLDIAALGAQVGGTYATTAARKLFATAERRVELDRERELKTAEAITERLGNMKGALMKLGQMASYVNDGLPEPMREALAQLQSNAPPMSAELAAGGDRARARCAARRAVRRVGPAADRFGQHRPGPPRRRRRPRDGARARRRGEGAVPRRRRGDRSRPPQRRACSGRS